MDRKAGEAPVYSVLIAGAGQIGAFYDQPGSAEVLSHAHAFHQHPGFSLLGFVDSDPAKAASAATRWGGRAYPDLEQALADLPEVVVVAVPDEYHYEILMRLAAEPGIKLVLAEKPLCSTLAQAREIEALYARNGKALAVNYLRRFVKNFRNSRLAIRTRHYGEFLGGSGCYGKGLMHNGSHMLDFLRFMIGDIERVTAVDCLHDAYEDDPSYSAVCMVAGQRPFYLQAVDSRYFFIFEMDLLFTEGRIQIRDAGMHAYYSAVQEDPLFAGYNRLAPVFDCDTGLDQGMAQMADHLYSYLQDEVLLACTGHDGVEAMRICLEIRESYLGQ